MNRPTRSAVVVPTMNLARSLGRPAVLAMIVAAGAALACTSAAVAGVPNIFYNELSQGDLSGNHLAPTGPFVLGPGSHRLVGELTGFGEPTFDRDFFSITIPAGYELTSITLDAYDSIDFASFMAFGPGSVLPFNPSGASPSDPTGWLLFGPDTVGQDMLEFMAQTTGAFTPPLPAGTYTFWVQQTGEYTLYEASWVVQPIPGPGALALLAAAPLAARRRRR